MKPVFAKKAARPDPELLTLKAELLEALGDLGQAYSQFVHALDPELLTLKAELLEAQGDQAQA